MFKRNKVLILGAAGCAALWVILFFALVAPQKSQRQDEIGEAEGRLERWVKYYQPAKGTVDLPRGRKELAAEKRLLGVAQKKLKAIEFASTATMKNFTLAAVTGPDPNTYFAKKRKEVLEALTRRYKIKLLAGLDDLGFRGKSKDAPVALNLTRLFAIERFFQAGARAGVAEVRAIRYYRPAKVQGVAGEDEELPFDPLVELPMLVLLRTTEQNLARFLYELQCPSDARRSYFCLRGLAVWVKEASLGMVDAWVAVGALFPKEQFVKELRVPFKGERETIRPTVRIPDY